MDMEGDCYLYIYIVEGDVVIYWYIYMNIDLYL